MEERGGGLHLHIPCTVGNSHAYTNAEAKKKKKKAHTRIVNQSNGSHAD